MRIEVLHELAVEQVRVSLEECLKARGPPPLLVDRDEVKPRSGERLVVLVCGSVASSDVPNRCCHDVGGLVDGMQVQVSPRELEMLAVSEGSAHANDLVEDLSVTAPHRLDRTRSFGGTQPAGGCLRTPNSADGELLA